MNNKMGDLYCMHHVGSEFLSRQASSCNKNINIENRKLFLAFSKYLGICHIGSSL